MSPAASPRRPLPHHPGGGDLEQVFRDEYARVVGLAHRVIGDRHAAEDIAQEVFLSYARSGVAAAEARGWLAVAATHLALNQIRTNQRRRTREERVDGDPALRGPEVASDPADDVVRSLERARVRKALAALPRAQATALLLRHSGLPYTDIADALGIAPSGVGTTLRRAEAALREELIHDGTPC